MNTINKKILLLSAHTDDAEWGCGASILKWKKAGFDIHSVAFSGCEESLPANVENQTLRKEFQASHDALGISKDNRRVLDFKVRYFPRDRQLILETLIKLRTEIKPGTILVHSSFDTHQDHATLHQEAYRAFKNSTILGYEVTWNNRSDDLSFFNEVTEEQVCGKIKSIECYQSQLFRLSDPARVVNALATVRGAQSGCRLAEAFEVIRWVDRY